MAPHRVLLLAKNYKAGCLFRPNFLKQVVIEIQKVEHPHQKFSKYPSPPPPPGVLHHYIFIISQLWLTFHPRSRVVLPDTETPGTSREIYSEDADGETRIRNPSVMNRVLWPLS